MPRSEDQKQNRILRRKQPTAKSDKPTKNSTAKPVAKEPKPSLNPVEAFLAVAVGDNKSEYRYWAREEIERMAMETGCYAWVEALHQVYSSIEYGATSVEAWR